MKPSLTITFDDLSEMQSFLAVIKDFSIRQNPVQNQCVVCGISFSSPHHKDYCSKKCYNKKYWAIYADKQRLKKELVPDITAQEKIEFPDSKDVTIMDEPEQQTIISIPSGADPVKPSMVEPEPDDNPYLKKAFVKKGFDCITGFD